MRERQAGALDAGLPDGRQSSEYRAAAARGGVVSPLRLISDHYRYATVNHCCAYTHLFVCMLPKYNGVDYPHAA
jgi:hypothetical protein